MKTTEMIIYLKAFASAFLVVGCAEIQTLDGNHIAFSPHDPSFETSKVNSDETMKQVSISLRNLDQSPSTHLNVALNDYERKISVHLKADEIQEAQEDCDNLSDWTESEELERGFSGTALMWQGVVAEKKEDYPKAIEILDEAIDLLQDAGPNWDERYAKALRFKGRCLSQMNDGALALSYLEQSLKILKAVEPYPASEAAHTLNDIGRSHKNVGEMERAENSYLKSIQLMDSLIGGNSLLSAKSMHLLCLLYTNNGQFDVAEAQCKKSLYIRERHLDDDSLQVARTLALLSESLFLNEKIQEALDYQRRLVSVCETPKSQCHDELADSKITLGVMLNALGNYKEATEVYKDVLRTYPKVDGKYRHPIALDNLAETYRQAGYYSKSKLLLEEALQVRVELFGSSSLDVAFSLGNFAIWHYMTADFDEAIRLGEESYSIMIRPEFSSIPLQVQRARLLMSLGLFYKNRGLYSEAEARLQLSLEVYEQVFGKGHGSQASLLSNLGGLYFDLGSYHLAESLYLQALDLFEKKFGLHHPKSAKLMGTIGVIYLAEGLHKDAENILLESLNIQRSLLKVDHIDIGAGLASLGYAQLLQGKILAAESSLAEAIGILEASKIPMESERLQNTYHLLGGLFAKQGRYGEAKELIARSRSTTIEHKDYRLEVAHSQTRLGVLLAQLGNHHEAEIVLRDALELIETLVRKTHPYYISTSNKLSQLLLSQGQESVAFELLHEALELSVEGWHTRSADISPVQAFAQLTQSQRCLDLLLSLPTNDQTDHVYRVALRSLGLLLEKQATIRLAYRSESGIEDLFKNYQGAIGKYSSLQSVSPPQSLNDQAREAWLEHFEAEKLKVWNDTQHLGAALAASSKLIGKHVNLAAADTQLPQLRRNELLVDFMIYNHSILGLSPNSLPTPHLVAFISKKGATVQRVELGPWEPIQSRIKAWRETFIDQGQQRFAETRLSTAHSLSKLLWEPLRPYIGEAERLLISPDGELALVPWGALPGKSMGITLLDESEIVLIPAPRLMGLVDVIENAGVQTEANEGLLVVSGVEYGDIREKSKSDPGNTETEDLLSSSTVLNRLLANRNRGARPDSGWEVMDGMAFEGKTILGLHQNLAPSESREHLSNLGATEDAFMKAAPKKRLIHLATHGYFEPIPEGSPTMRSGWQEPLSLENPRPIGRPPQLRTGLVFAGANDDPELGESDGLLTAWELASLDLTGVELVVLAACQTAEGEATSGEGVLSLQRALTAAGVRHSVTSLWQVEDGATLVLMERFYRNLLEKDLGPISALANAQRWLQSNEGMNALKERDALFLDSDGAVHPALWAGWVVAGEPR